MRFLALFIFIQVPLIFFGQQNSFLITISDKFIVDSYIQKSDGFFHTSFKPIVKSTISGYSKIDSTIYRTGSDSAFISRKKHPWIWKKILTESFVDVKKDKFVLRVDPILNFEYGKDSLGRMSVNSRGVVIYGDLSDKFSFTTGVLETQVFPEKYVSDYMKLRSVSPGQGRVRLFKKTGFDYAYSFGNISYSPSSHFNFQLGHGKQFLGDGYRSLLLSDVPFYYPYLRVTSTFKRFQYINLWTSFQEVKPYDNRTLVYQRKHGSFSYLSYLLSKKIELGLFEAIMFQSTDTNSNSILPIDVANPIIGVRTMQYGFRYKHNALIGITAKANILKQITVYGQFVLDDMNRKGETGRFHKRYGYQIGLKFLEPLKIKNLFILTEYNFVNPFTYSPSVVNQSYTAFNEPLAHPLGANFKEFVVLGRYSYKDLFCQVKLTHLTFLNGGSAIYSGTNIFEYNNESIVLPQNTASLMNIVNFNFEVGITINQKNRLQLVVGAHNRSTNFDGTAYYYFALRTSISNLYYDF
ncbi:MAG: hypothetical protein HY951_02565 [Bacteroidia bacterium]|nr:hypothetical protein [Bacteroidia bacterium]